MHTVKGFTIAIAVVLTLSVGLAYAVKVNWLLDHGQPAYSYDQEGAVVPVFDLIGPR